MRVDAPVVQVGAPVLRQRVDIWPLFSSSPSHPGVFLIGHKELDSYVTVPESKLPVIRVILPMLDGRHTPEEIDAHILAQCHKSVHSAQLCEQLARAGLLEGTECPKGDVAKASFTLSSIRLDGLLQRFSRIPPALLSAAGAAGLAIIVLGLCLLTSSWHNLMSPLAAVWRGQARLFTLQALGTYAAVCAVSVLLHELAHALAGARFGLIARRLEFAMYLGIVPIVFLRIPGLYTVTPRRRIVIWSAGVFMNLVIAAVAMMNMAWTGTGSNATGVCYVFILVNYSFAVTNLIPFLPTDGYFILSTICRVHNIRRNAIRQLSRSIETRRVRFSVLGIVYLALSAVLLGLTLWRDVILVSRLHAGHATSADIFASLLILPWLLLVIQLWRWRSRLFS